MSFTKVWIHSVWGTKNRERILLKESRLVLFQHIKENGLKKGIHVDTINGHLDHVHCLFKLPVEMALSKALQLLKGEASHWANKEGFIKPKLEWADEYFAASVSESLLLKVRHYIDNQEEHHKKVTFEQEYTMLMEKLGVQKKPRVI